MAPDPLCSCGEVETIEHYLLLCPNFTAQRQILSNELLNLGITNLSVQTTLEGIEDTPEDKI